MIRLFCPRITRIDANVGERGKTGQKEIFLVQLTTLRLTSTHAEGHRAQAFLTRLSLFLSGLNNAAEQLLQCLAPITSQVCLSTIEDVTTNPLGAIWIRPVDYREAVRGTPFDPDLPRRERVYRRQTERENLIATRVRKWRLFDDVR